MVTKATETFAASCGGMDHGGCGLIVTVKNGRVTRIKGDPQCPHGSMGYICAKAPALREIIESPDRLTKPLRRIGERGQNNWEEIAWTDAIDMVASNLDRIKRKYGPEAVAFMRGAPKGLESRVLFRFAHAFGSPNVVSTAGVCFAPRLGASMVTCGYFPLPDYRGGPSCILVWGSNPLATNPDGVLAAEVRAALKKRPKLIVVDPRRTSLAAKADVWLQPRPGSDGILAIGVLKAVVGNGWYDHKFVTNWTLGFGELEKRLAQYSMEEIEKLTWIPKERIIETARLYAENRPACLQWGNALDQSVNSVQTARALLILSAISGNLEVPGGDIRPPELPLLEASEFTLAEKARKSSRPIIGSEYKMASFFNFVPYQLAVEAMLTGCPYPIKAAYVQGTNPLLTYPDAKKTFQALSGLEFLVVADLFMTPTAALADVVLPVAAHFEYDDLAFYGLPWGRVIARPKLLDPPGECRSDIAILSELARRLGFGELFWDTEEECINTILAPSGKSFKELRQELVLVGRVQYYQYKQRGFPTPSGKFEISSERLKQWGYDPLPHALLNLPETTPEYPLVLTSAKDPYYFHSANRNLASLRRRAPEPVVDLHPETAREYGLGDGDWVYIETRKGRIKQRLKVREDVPPRVAIASFGWWFPERGEGDLYGWEEANINLLTSADPPYDPLIGSVPLRGIPCRLERNGR